jgi:catechol-2,3-dioxygenase
MSFLIAAVADLDRALGFYRDVLGFEVTQRYGTQAAFLSAGGYHHHIGLNTWESLGGSPPPHGTTGPYHLAILYPTRAELGDALRRLITAGINLKGASDHGVSEALYLRDPAVPTRPNGSSFSLTAAPEPALAMANGQSPATGTALHRSDLASSRHFSIVSGLTT